MEQSLADCIKKHIEEKVNKEYTAYKEKCLDELDYKIECKRNQVISSILDRIAIEVQNRQEFSLEPAINIRVETRPIIKMEDK